MVKKTKKHKYRVWIEQVNETYVEVTAKDAEEARDKGYRKWRREDAHASVTYVGKLKVPNA